MTARALRLSVATAFLLGMVGFAMARPGYPPPGGSGSGTVTEVTGTSPISVSTGTTTPVVSMTAASGATSGYVTAAAQQFNGAKTFANSPTTAGAWLNSTADQGMRNSAGTVVVSGTDGNTAGTIGAIVGSHSTVNTAGAKTVSFQAGLGATPSTTHAFPWEGGVQLNPACTAEPTCDSSNVNVLTVVCGGAAGNDALKICLQASDDNYDWYTLVTAAP